MIAVYSCLTQQHDLKLVALAGLICLVSTSIGVDLLARGRRRSQSGFAKWVLLLGASLVCSTGIWATHFLSMLAYDIGLPIGFELFPTVVSIAVGIATNTFGFALVSGANRWWRIALSGLIIGGGVGLLHYEGMAGLILPGRVGWNTPLIVASICAGIICSVVAITLIARDRGLSSRLGAAVAFSMGVVSLHFTGMAAISITPDIMLEMANGFPHQAIAIAITVGVSAIAAAAMITSIFDQIVIRRGLQEADRLGKINDDLTRARDLAEAANQAKSVFLAMMSHEIRTPLTGLIGMIDLMAHTASAADRHNHIALARESAEHLLIVINDVLDFSQLEAGKLQTEVIDFDPARLVHSTTELFRAAATRKGLQLKTHTAPDLPPWLNGDPHRTRQILSNLLNNALKFTATGIVEVSATHRVRGDHTMQLHIDVTDSGVGIADDAMDRLFTPFEQADTSTSRRYGGSGLGLSICRKLCDLLKGDIGVAQRPAGAGSRFWFWVPCTKGTAVGPELPSPPLALTKSLSVLVAEDTPIIASLIRSLLAQEGHRATMVVNGREAVAMVQNRPFDLLLMDIQMPELDGVSAARTIRALPAPIASIPIIALTANTTAYDRDAYAAAGITDCVTKPIRPHELFRSIASCTALRPFSGSHHKEDASSQRLRSA
ncbi:MHYT domain-containing protein [Bradyrhizobium betae]|uniref:MHYT domain-containing protein n=1 Tax=Bradyrhizobium betae TaxID=244734 RepID=UPI003D6695B1